MAQGEKWKLDVVDTPRGREYRGIIGSDEDEGEKGDGEKKDGREGGEKKSLKKTLGLEKKNGSLPPDLDWVNQDLTTSYSPIARPGETAQVHPYLFTTSMLDLAVAQGVTYVHGKADRIDVDEPTRSVSGVTFTNAEGKKETLYATHVVLAAGVWSPTLVPSLPIQGTRAHSITIRPPPNTPISPYVLFTEILLPSPHRHPEEKKEEASPEIYPRPSGEVYCCGSTDTDTAVPPTVDDVPVSEAACDLIKTHVSSISPQLRHGVVDKKQACFLPVVQSGRGRGGGGSSGGGPIVGEAKKIAKGLVIATGHSCWVCF